FYNSLTADLRMRCWHILRSLRYLLCNFYTLNRTSGSCLDIKTFDLRLLSFDSDALGLGIWVVV
ncbi:MAG: hypothetical protein ACK49X_06895, partial [Akkermansiaceae bacterium]